jgi:hypothetical protein
MHIIINKVIVNYLSNCRRQIYEQIDQHDNSSIDARSN